jgi:type I toxin-antitoxin system toxin SymE
MTNRIRTLTVSRLYREWGELHRKRECTVPSIRLSGKWLSRLGIAPGQKIRVATNGATITIAPVTFENENELCHYGERAQGQYIRATSAQ